MLVARRDPPLHVGAYDGSRAHHGHAYGPRLMTALQMIGTLVGIPVGLVSIYSIYHSNFTVEARCETLRGNIISMLDRSSDASTLRVLVRRDVAAFETSCGAVDPDAVKAFKTLLMAKTTPPAHVAPPAPAAAPPQQAAREPARRPAEGVKQVPPPKPTTAGVDARPMRRDAETLDAHWIASVRDALTHTSTAHDEAIETPTPARSPSALQAIPPQPRVVHEGPPQLRGVDEAPPMSLSAPAAPTLPAPVPIAAAPTPAPAADHPVPPGSIPDAQPDASLTEKSAERSGHSWMSEVPILNRVAGH